MIGTASHCVINVNLGGPSMINTERQREELEMNVLSAIDYSELFHPYQTTFILYVLSSIEYCTLS